MFRLTEPGGNSRPPCREKVGHGAGKARPCRSGRHVSLLRVPGITADFRHHSGPTRGGRHVYCVGR